MHHGWSGGRRPPRGTQRAALAAALTGGAAQTNLYFYNAGLFREAGLPTPYELWKRDRWTWEAFLDGQRVEAEGMAAVPFSRQAQEVYLRALRQVATLEHPEAIREILNRYAFSRAAAPDGPELLRLVNRELDPFMGNERDVRTATLAAAARADEYLRDHPQS